MPFKVMGKLSGEATQLFLFKVSLFNWSLKRRNLLLGCTNSLYISVSILLFYVLLGLERGKSDQINRARLFRELLQLVMDSFSRTVLTKSNVKVFFAKNGSSLRIQ